MDRHLRLIFRHSVGETAVLKSGSKMAAIKDDGEIEDLQVVWKWCRGAELNRRHTDFQSPQALFPQLITDTIYLSKHLSL